MPNSLAIAQLDKTTVPTEITAFYNQCAADKTAGSTDQTLLLRCKLMRNRIVYDLKLIIDRNYEDYAKAFEQTANTLDFGMEVAATTLSGVATIADTGIKDLLSLASTLTQSTEAATQKNFYQKQTAFTILAVMNSQRLDKWKDILQSMDNELDDYPLSAALADLAGYRMQGTAEAAFEAIQKTAGTTQDKAKEVIDGTKGINQAPTASLTVDQSTLTRGESATLSWQTSGAAGVNIDQGIGTVQANGSRQVSPTASTTYTLTAKGAGGAHTSTVTVTVH